MHATKVGSKRLKSLSIQARRERLITRTNKREFCHEMSSGGVRMYLAIVVVGQPMGWGTVLKECHNKPKTISEALGVKGINHMESDHYKMGK